MFSFIHAGTSVYFMTPAGTSTMPVALKCPLMPTDFAPMTTATARSITLP